MWFDKKANLAWRERNFGGVDLVIIDCIALRQQSDGWAVRTKRKWKYGKDCCVGEQDQRAGIGGDIAAARARSIERLNSKLETRNLESRLDYGPPSKHRFLNFQSQSPSNSRRLQTKYSLPWTPRLDGDYIWLDICKTNDRGWKASERNWT
jgi:hypothetical protein